MPRARDRWNQPCHGVVRVCDQQDTGEASRAFHDLPNDALYGDDGHTFFDAVPRSPVDDSRLEPSAQVLRHNLGGKQGLLEILFEAQETGDDRFPLEFQQLDPLLLHLLDEFAQQPVLLLEFNEIHVSPPEAFEEADALGHAFLKRSGEFQKALLEGIRLGLLLRPRKQHGNRTAQQHQEERRVPMPLE